ncbi:helix-turn-helix domain-containing protein [Reichenbachiella versicolor]|uniref:helix-turn-helix domain-containing protein n=1 Tax=Reichenbachiella versicolor TaxID=1821036 RepID=UPI000D6DDC4B|nr:response regulator transcription factor [Reichenbachiella versicolor]
MTPINTVRLETISDLHRFNEIPSPEHPLISLIDYSLVKQTSVTNELKWIQSYYSISLKRNVIGKYRYGQQSYDFDEGVMTFFSPDQLISVQLLESNTITNPPSGWILAIHPDFFFGTSLARDIQKYPFFKYSVREALFLSEKEEQVILSILKNIEAEYQTNIDQFSQQIIMNQLVLLLSYAERFYKRQFLTRKISNHKILQKLEEYLDDYFDENSAINKGLPSVHEIAKYLNVSPDYLSSMLKSLTGQNTQQHIHHKLIEMAKVKLSASESSVSEIAYSLGFEHPQSFSKFFKSKTNQTPLEYRISFN